MQVNTLTTGGTVDKIYFDAKSEFQVGDPQIGELLKEANVGFDFQVESIMRNDSMEITDEDRAVIRQRVEQAPCNRILDTHGTDTMLNTANALLDLGVCVVMNGHVFDPRTTRNNVEQRRFEQVS